MQDSLIASKTMKKTMNVRMLVLVAITMLAGVFRVLQTAGHVPFSNFTPIGAMALFGGAYFSSRPKAYLFPLLTLFVSDVVLMNTVYADHSNGLLYEGWYVIYFAFGLMVFLGQHLIRKVSVKSVVLAGVLAGLSHFIIADFAVWFRGGTDLSTGLPFTRDWRGLMQCYIQALPFLKNMVAGNLIFGAVFFGGFELAKYRFPVLEKPQIAA